MGLHTLSGSVFSRRSRLEKNKDESYHLDMARYFIDNRSINTAIHQMNVLKSRVNRNFYKGNQWIFDEDLDPFLMDEDGNARNRIRWVHNIIKPLVNHYTGTAIKLDFSAYAKSISRESMNRRRLAEASLLGIQEHVDSMPEFAESIKKAFDVGDTKEETLEIFDSKYVDKYEKGVNKIINVVSSANRFNRKKQTLAKNIALDGIGILYERLRNGEQVFEVLDMNEFIYDIDCKEEDMSDAEFLGCVKKKIPTQLFEENPGLSKNEMESIEKLATYGGFDYVSTGNSKSGRVSEYSLYWVDSEKREYAFVRDEFNDIVFMEINSESSKYTTKDIVIPEDDDSKELLEGGKSIFIYIDSIRYCRFVYGSASDRDVSTNIVLDYGIFYMSDSMSFESNKVLYPFSVYTWDFQDGEIIAPVDDLISPQRYINRILSVSESHVNNARQAGTILDTSVLDDEEGEEGINRKMNLGKPLLVNAKRQVNNVVGTYGSGIDPKILSFYDLAVKMKDMAGTSSGFNKELSGTVGAYRSSASIAMNNLQQGSIMQEPVFFALSEILLNAYRSIVNRGLKYYVKNRRRFRVMVGNDIADSFILDPSFNSERWDIEFMKSETSINERDLANEQLISFLQIGLIDDKQFAQAFNNSNRNDVGYILREASAMRARAEIDKRNAQKVSSEGAAIRDEALMQKQNINDERAALLDATKQEASILGKMK